MDICGNRLAHCALKHRPTHVTSAYSAAGAGGHEFGEINPHTVLRCTKIMTDEGKPLLSVRAYTAEPESDVSLEVPSWRSKSRPLPVPRGHFIVIDSICPPP